MKRYIILSVLLLNAFSVQATPMSPERSNCLSLQKIATDHQEWKNEFSRFLVDTQYPRSQKIEPLRQSITMLTDRLEAIKIAGRVTVNQQLVDQPRAFLKEFNAGRIDIDIDIGYKMMTTGLRNLEDEIDTALLKAHLKSQTCDVLQDQKSNQSTINSGKSGIR